MVPAMDRNNLVFSRARWIGLGLTLVLMDLGCSRMNPFRTAPDPPMLGRVTDTTDIYKMSRRPGPAVDSAVMPEGAEVGEVGLAMRAGAASGAEGRNGVALQAPDQVDPRPRSESKSTDGVPNAGLTLASIGRRAEPTPAEIVAEARTALDAMSSYEVSLHRQERVNGTLLPEEDVVLAIRREPKAVRLTWPSGPNQGLEVLYRSDEPNGPMHVKMANSALPRLTLAPESPMVMRNSRHPVTEAGLDSIVEGLENALRAPAASSITYAGRETVEGLDQPQHCLQRTSPTGDVWRIDFDPTTHLPTIVQARDENGRLLELYRFGVPRPNPPELAGNDAFDPTARWGPARGLFGRVARGDSTEPAATPR